MNVFGFQPGRSSGVVDTSGISAEELLEKIEALEAISSSIAIAYRNTEQETGANVDERLKINKAISDPNSLFDLVNGWYTVPSNGYYQVNGNLLYQTTVAATVLCHIAVNGTNRVQGVEQAGTTAGFFAVTVSGIILCKAGDKIELIMRTTSKSKLSLAEDRNQMSIARVG